MIALPLQNNTNFGAGPQEKTTTNDLNIQPVVPVGLGKVLLINRVVLPISYQGEFVPDRSINPPPSIVPPDQLGTKTGLGVHRVVLPISYQGEFVPDRPINPPPSLVPPDQLGTKTGLGDTTYTAWFAPAGAGSVTCYMPPR